MADTEVAVAEPKLSPHLRFMLTELSGERFKRYTVPEHIAIVGRVVNALQKEPTATTMNTELLLTTRLYLSAATLAARYRASQESAKDRLNQVESEAAIAIRAAIEAREEKATEKRVEYEVERDASVQAAKRDVVAFTELTDVMFSLRECVRMRHEMLAQIANNLRAEMKLEVRS